VSWVTATFGSPEALAELVVAGVVCGVVGVHVVLRHLPFLSIGLTHATFPGLVLAGLLGVNLVAGSLAFGVVVVVAIALLGAADRMGSSTAIGVVLSAGFALGVVLVSSADGFSRDLTAYLVGSVATVSPTDVAVAAGAGVVVLAALAAFHKELVLAAFDPGSLAARGYPVLALDLLLLVAVEVTIVTALPAMGTILAVSLLVSPAATARLWTDRVGTAMALAAAVGAGSGVVGLAVSVAAHTATGATVALVAGGVLAVSAAASAVVAPAHRRRDRAPEGPVGATA
jgi:ABC-type Mn2+/Zn2+ transport system permease subunit